MYRKDRKEEYFTRKAQEEGYPARSVYKLQEIDKQFEIIKEGDSVLDLGAAPGSWLLYLSQKVGDRGTVIGFDVEDINIQSRENIMFYKKSVRDEDIFEILKGKKFDSVVADMSPKTTGIKLIDCGLSLELDERAFEIVKAVLKENGNFVFKIFESGDIDAFINEVSLRFKTVKKFRPRAVISKSKEFYVVAKGYKIKK
jgi:23S rRNA (uridine2552-2'-O)-methyltransferase